MEADTIFNALLTVQDHDLHADRLDHRREALPERDALAEVRSQLDELADARERAVAQARELGREQTRQEDEITGLEDKVARDERLLYGGTVSNLRELQALQDDIAATKRRVSDLEDVGLELLDRLEPVEAEITRLDEQIDAARSRETVRAAELASAEEVIDAELDEVRAARGEAASTVSAELLAEYERLRGSLGGIGVARLVGNRCDGCQLTLAAAEVERVKRLEPGALAHCEECGRILVV